MDTASQPFNAEQVADPFLDRIRQSAEEIEETRRMPDDLANDMIKAGVCHLLIPKSLGGYEADFPDFLNMVQKVAAADGSTGWCVNQTSIFGFTSLHLPPHAARKIWDSGVVANGPPIHSEAIPVDGGFRLTGRWGFSSGCEHATWMCGVAPIKSDERSGAVWCYVPKAEVTFHDTWHVRGLRGTGSHEFELKDHFVPVDFTMSYRTPTSGSDLYLIPLNLAFACGFGTVALGVARGAIDYTIQVASGKVPRFMKKELRHEESIQARVGRAETLWHAADTFLHSTVESVWEDICQHHRISDESRIRMRMAGTHTIRQCKDVVDICYSICSSDSIFEQNDIQRRFQDIHVISQHLQGRTNMYAIVGKYFLDLPFESYALN